jgi:hypothetical protein
LSLEREALGPFSFGARERARDLAHDGLLLFSGDGLLLRCQIGLVVEFGELQNKCFHVTRSGDDDAARVAAEAEPAHQRVVDGRCPRKRKQKNSFEADRRAEG